MSRVPLGSGQMVASLANSREMVDPSYATGLANGGTCEGAPTLRPENHDSYYSAYMHDTEENELCGSLCGSTLNGLTRSLITASSAS